MTTFKFHTITQCGKHNIIVQQANTLFEAKENFKKHNILKHTPMVLTKIEFKLNNTWFKI